MVPPPPELLHLPTPQELNSSPHHLVATTTRSWHPTVNAWRLSQGSPRTLNSSLPPSILTPAEFLPCLDLCRCQGVSVSAAGRLSSWDTSSGYPASHTHRI